MIRVTNMTKFYQMGDSLVHALDGVDLAVPPGEFVIGSAGGHPDEQPPHATKVARGFWVSRHEITNDQFKQFNPKHESREEDRHGYQFGITGYDQDRPEQPAVERAQPVVQARLPA